MFMSFFMTISCKNLRSDPDQNPTNNSDPYGTGSETLFILLNAEPIPALYFNAFPMCRPYIAIGTARSELPESIKIK